eukprot:Selendium_serpulae@DN7362_c0_g1_i1.p1
MILVCPVENARTHFATCGQVSDSLVLEPPINWLDGDISPLHNTKKIKAPADDISELPASTLGKIFGGSAESSDDAGIAPEESQMTTLTGYRNDTSMRQGIQPLPTLIEDLNNRQAGKTKSESFDDIHKRHPANEGAQKCRDMPPTHVLCVD